MVPTLPEWNPNVFSNFIMINDIYIILSEFSKKHFLIDLLIKKHGVIPATARRKNFWSSSSPGLILVMLTATTKSSRLLRNLLNNMKPSKSMPRGVVMREWRRSKYSSCSNFVRIVERRRIFAKSTWYYNNKKDHIFDLLELWNKHESPVLFPCNSTVKAFLRTKRTSSVNLK